MLIGQLQSLQERKRSVEEACITYLDNYGLPTGLSAFSGKRGAHSVQAPKSFFPAPLSGYLSCKLNFPELSGLLPLLSSELAGVGGHFQRQRLLAVGPTAPSYNTLTQVRAGGCRFKADLHICLCTIVSCRLVECFGFSEMSASTDIIL